MLKTRLIPTLLSNQMSLVKGKSFDSWRVISSIIPSVRVYNQRDVDELMFFDIVANGDGIDIDFELVEELCANCFVPLTYGGGIQNLDDVQRLMRLGVDKVAINTHSYDSLDIISSLSKKHGAQSIVGCVDCKRNENGGWDCYSHSGKLKQDKDLSDWVKQLQSAGAGEILITSIDQDGHMNGYDLELIHLVSSSVDIPVIASGGAGQKDDFVDAVKKSKASAVAAASIFHFTEATPKEVKSYMNSAGIPTRMV